ncbi:type II CRISPR RNA-guided endonuclease Cas9 [Laribacter hongkongensis]|uniref:CRISPR-associated endonuclease Cas9 n=1 Tax=Laribacter hongkongensis TaxID=168471 RepID=A0ABD4SRI4_9NEIS|nr:type II CRISPR RNA-guided endonuclease Cas9 [Laribacter hongkongensis]MCG9026077.1 hypothetical protein [Laribacter hongkongensis]MCG9101985.1 hypothetical protein [Laribacter hongkongensis]MCG9119695.1 hypothetical protein [Laribacter hongkongensis]
MAYKIGVDLGTASIGACVISLNEKQVPASIPHHGVRIFSEPVERGQKGLAPKKAARRDARQQRRQIERRARRLRRVSHLAFLLGLDRQCLMPDSGQNLTRLRAEAASHVIGFPDLFNVFMRLAKRRGYTGGFKDDGSESKVVKAGIEVLAGQMAELAAAQGKETVTLGEFLWHRQQQGLPIYLKADRPSLTPLFAHRDMVQAEFEQIWRVQAAAHPQLNGTHLEKPIRQWFFDAIFHQRPLKSPALMVGSCLLEPDMPRAPRAQMAAQQFRIEKVLRDLRWGGGRQAERLSPAQLAVIRPLFDQYAEISFSTLLSALDKNNMADPRGRTLNLDRGHGLKLKGNTTLAAWRSMGMLEDWLSLTPAQQVTVINLLADLGSPEILAPEDWHLRMPKANTSKNKKKSGQSPESPFRSFSPEIVAFINRLKASGHYSRFSSMGFESGRSSYSIKALNRLNEWLAAPWWQSGEAESTRRGEIDEDAAIRQCYPRHFVTQTTLTDRLSEPPRSGNDVVDVALRELRGVINRCIEAMGGEHPQEIIVEMSREVGRGVKARNEMEKRMQENKKHKEGIRKILNDQKVTATQTAILRYQLWEEQDKHFCPYCDEPINLQAAMSGIETQIEHILPRNLTQVGRKRSELVLAHARCNVMKGDATPWQAFGHDAQRWAAVERAIKRFEELGKGLYAKDRPQAIIFYRKAHLLSLKDYEREVLTDESIAGFADRQFHQTSWIAKLAAQWLRQITPLVSVSRGEFTALLRRQWHLDTVIPQLRYAEGLSVRDEDGQLISQEDFERYRHQWEGQRPQPGEQAVEFRPDKRIDHRHHGLDALVIALTSRSLYMDLARRYKEECEKRAAGAKYRREWSIAPPMSHLRDQAVAMLQKCRVSHKPDRHASGALFKDSAYGESLREGKKYLTIHRKLSDLNGEKGIADIVSDEVRQIVLAAFTARVAAGLTPTQALATPVDYPHYKTRIWRVKCFAGAADSAIRIEHESRQGTHIKYLLSDSYACLEVQKSKDGKKPITRLITLHEASQPAFRKRKAKGMRFYKGDLVINTKDNKCYRIGYFKKEGDVYLIHHLDPRGYGEIKTTEKNSGKRVMAFSQAVHLKGLE